MSATELVIGGMTRAPCAARNEKKPKKLDGVTATVKLPTHTPRVDFPPAVTIGDLIAVVEQAGYTAAVPAPRPEAAGAGGERAAAGAGLLGEGSGNAEEGALQIADGYHRVCASYHLDENTDIPFRMAVLGRGPVS